jgi:hypothetical protein
MGDKHPIKPFIAHAKIRQGANQQKEAEMIKIMYSSEKSNSFRPTPWHWSLDKFPAFRGAGARYTAFQPTSRGYKPRWEGEPPSSDGYRCPRVAVDTNYCKVIKTQKGTQLIIPCSKEQDEKIMLLTLRGGFRGSYGRVEAVDAETLFQRGGNIHGVHTIHMVVRLLKPTGYVVAETGRRSSTGTTEIFSWDGYQTMRTEEFEVWQETLELEL